MGNTNMRSGYYVVIDLRVNEYVGPSTRGTKPYLFMARFYLSAIDALERLTKHGFGDVPASKLKIMSADEAPLTTYNHALRDTLYNSPIPTVKQAADQRRAFNEAIEKALARQPKHSPKRT